MRAFLAVATAATALLSSTGAAAADFAGSTLNFTYYFPDTATVYSSADYVVGPGLEVPNVAGDPAITLDIGSSSLLVNFYRPATFSVFPFNGWVLSDQINGLDDITGVTINPASNWGSFNASNPLAFTSDSITVNWSGLPFDASNSLLLDVTFASGVPEPATWGMMLLGFGAVGYAMRRRRRQAALMQTA